MKRALQVILGISLFGATFSGILSYREIFGQRFVQDFVAAWNKVMNLNRFDVA